MCQLAGSYMVQQQVLTSSLSLAERIFRQVRCVTCTSLRMAVTIVCTKGTAKPRAAAHRSVW